MIDDDRPPAGTQGGEQQDRYARCSCRCRHGDGILDRIAEHYGRRNRMAGKQRQPRRCRWRWPQDDRAEILDYAG